MLGYVKLLEEARKAFPDLEEIKRLVERDADVSKEVSSKIKEFVEKLPGFLKAMARSWMDRASRAKGKELLGYLKFVRKDVAEYFEEDPKAYRWFLKNAISTLKKLGVEPKALQEEYASL